MSIKVGDLVTVGPMNNMLVIATYKDVAWCKYDEHLYFTQYLGNLKKIEPKFKVYDDFSNVYSFYTKEDALAKASDLLREGVMVYIKELSGV